MRKLTGSARYIFFVIVICSLASTVEIFRLKQENSEKQRAFTHSLATDLASTIEMNISRTLSATYAVATMVRKNQGQIDDFHHFAADILHFYPGVSALQLAPDGKIQHSHPLQGNEKIIGYDLLAAGHGDPAAHRAVKTGQLTVTEPVNLIQGGRGIIGRLPITLSQNGVSQFWGFGSVLIRTPDLLHETDLQRLENLQLGYQLRSVRQASDNAIQTRTTRTDAEKTDASRTDAITKNVLIASADFNAASAISVPIQFANSHWLLSISPPANWPGNGWLSFNVLFSILTTILLISGVYALYRLQIMREGLEQTIQQRTRTIQDTLAHAELALKAANQSWFQLDSASRQLSTADQHLNQDRQDTYNPLSDAGLSTAQQQHFIDAVSQRYQQQAEQAAALLSDSKPSDTQLKMEYLASQADGSRRWLQVTARPVSSHRGEQHLIGVITDISHQRQARLQEQARLQVMDKLVHNLPLTEILGAIIELIEHNGSGALCSILLVNSEQQTLTLGAAPNLPATYNHAIDGISYGEGIGSCGTAVARRARVIVEDINTHPYWAAYKTLALQAGLQACWSEPIINTQGEVLGTFAIYHPQPQSPSPRDLETIEFAAHLALLAIEKNRALERMNLLLRFFNEADEGIVVTDINGLIIDVNPKFTRVTGYTLEEVRQQNPSMLKSGRQSPEFYQAMWQQLKETGHWQGELWNRRRDGQIYAEKLTISSITNDAGEVTNYVGIFADITHVKDQQQALQKMAYEDPLTGLANRTRLTEIFQHKATQCHQDNTRLAVCFLDLDNFKEVNDNYGHSAGDELLKQVSHRILGCLRSEDTLARLGGDEFAILLCSLQSVENCQQIMARIHRLIAEPFTLAEHQIHISASSGITLSPDDQSSDEHADLDTLLRHADKAMYQVKVQGKNSFQFFNAQHDIQLADIHKRQTAVEQALHNGELQLYYQPKVNMRTGKVWGAEALIRWQHPQQGLIPPHTFLPHIANSPVELEVGNWVINQALQQQVSWQSMGLSLEVSINVSAFHLLSSNFYDELATAIDHHPDLQCQNLQLEILESSDFDNLPAIEKVINHCRQTLGTGFALDDFGTGFSSLAHLRDLSADTVKIDCSFIRELMSNPNDFRIVEGIVRLSKAFDRHVIAEGVESVWEGQMLLLMGCENAQGYGIARPMPAAELPNWINHYRPFDSWRHIQIPGPASTGRFELASLFRLVLEYRLYRLTQLLEQRSQNAPGTDSRTPDADTGMPNTCYAQSHFAIWLNRCRKEQTSGQLTKDILQLEASLKASYSQTTAVITALESADHEQAWHQLTLLQQQTGALLEQLQQLQNGESLLLN
ncbi:MAG: EAL domain-containing protein [Marinobacterium sp.]|nr:EAL domain-containing protein [Marinobacterium sp.]